MTENSTPTAEFKKETYASEKAQQPPAAAKTWRDYFHEILKGISLFK